MNSIMLLHCKSCVDINVDINFSPEIMSGSVDFYFLYETKVFVNLPIIHCISCSFDVTSFHNVFYQQTGQKFFFFLFCLKKKFLQISADRFCWGPKSDSMYIYISISVFVCLVVQPNHRVEVIICVMPSAFWLALQEISLQIHLS